MSAIILDFNPRSHERSDVTFVPLIVANCIFQSTLPREERQEKLSELWGNIKISIHAPTRGATRIFLKGFGDKNISIHAPTRGATFGDWGNVFFVKFQSTLPREERLGNREKTANNHYFNPRSHERSDSNIAQKICLFLYNTDNKYIIR